MKELIVGLVSIVAAVAAASVITSGYLNLIEKMAVSIAILFVAASLVDRIAKLDSRSQMIKRLDEWNKRAKGGGDDA